MIEKNNESTTLFIPTNIKTRMEFFNGFGVPELISTIAMTGCTAAVAAILYALLSVSITTLVFAVLVVMALTVTVTAKTESNICVIDQIGFLIAFAKAQKWYAYIYKEDWIP